VAVNVRRVTEPVLRNKNYLKTTLERRAGEKKEADAKWYKDNPSKQPGWNDNYTWKTFSRIRAGSDEFRENYDMINWGSDSDNAEE
jgi:hypothetical protein